MVKSRTSRKKIPLVSHKDTSPNTGSVNISWTVAPVRGRAMKGPMQRMIADSMISPGTLPIRVVMVEISPPFRINAKIARMALPMSAR